MSERGGRPSAAAQVDGRRPGDGKLLNWRLRHSQSISRAGAYAASLLVAAPFIYHIARRSPAFLGLLEDDYYYYVTIADHLVSAGRLTYDGTTVTNGFHPLWFAVLATLRAVFGRFGSAFYLALTAVFIGSMLLTYELSRRFARALGASRGASALAPAVYAFSTAQLLTDGMECVLAVPLFLWLLNEIARPAAVTPRRAAKIGLISSLAILARLDIAVAVALIVIGYAAVVRPTVTAFFSRLLAFCAAGLLVPLYAAANLAFFGSPLPVSALAKRLVVEAGISFAYARAAAFGTVYGWTAGLLVALGLVSLVALVRRTPGERPHGRFAGGVALVFPFVFFAMNTLSGWTYFGWYAFPYVAATVAALVLIHERWPLRVGPRARAVVMVGLAMLPPVLAMRYAIERGPLGSVRDNTLLALSFDLADHLKDRQGLFAMGAIAGMSAYIMDKPVLQIEGIVADRAMVEHVRRQDRLQDVLAAYHADFLIVSLAKVRAERRDGCYLVTQPNAEWAGRRTAKMSGRICSEPIAHFFTPQGNNPWSAFPTIETMVWDLREATWR